jgi:hypothetical protein
MGANIAQPAIGDPENDPENFIDAETATINALNAECGNQGVAIGGPPGRIAGFNLAGTTAEDAVLGNVRAVAVIWTEDDRSGGAPAVSVDEGIADAVFAAFPPNS